MTRTYAGKIGWITVRVFIRFNHAHSAYWRLYIYTMAADLISWSSTQLNTSGTTAFIQLLVSVPGEMTAGYLYCQVMRTSLPSPGINRYSRPDLASPKSLSSFSTISVSLCPVSHHVSLLPVMTSHSLLWKSSALFSRRFPASSSLHRPMLISSVSSFFSHSKIQHSLYQKTLLTADLEYKYQCHNVPGLLHCTCQLTVA